MAKRRLAAIIAADVVGYSRLMGVDEEGTLSAIRTLRDKLIDPLVSNHDGHLVKTTGDGLLLEFPSVVQAVACAVAVQRGMLERNREIPEELRIAIRIGINVGDVIIEDGDVFGDGVNVAARLEQIAVPGGIAMSGDSYRHVRGKLDVNVIDDGQQQLKNITRPVRVYRINDITPVTGTPTSVVRRKRWQVPAIAGMAATSVAIVAASLWFLVGPVKIQTQPSQTQMSTRPPIHRTFPIIAVLPFANQTGDKDQDYFADGVTEEVINALGRFNSLRVIGRNAIRPYKERPATRGEISSQLGASYLVEGSVRRADERVRIAAQLTDAATGTVLWTERYDGELSDVFDFQDTIARQIAGKLAANITRIKGEQLLTRPKPDLNSYDLVLRARAIGFTGSRKSNRRFRELVAEAIKIDPGYAAAHALLAEALFMKVILGWSGLPDRDLSRGEELARKAIRLAPDKPDGHRALGRSLVLRTEYEQASNELRRAIEINPSDAYALAVWGDVQSFVGDLAGAIKSLELALKYDPALEAVFVFDLAVSYYLSHQNEDAIRIAERGLSQYPEFAMFNVPAAAAAARLGRSEHAKLYVERIRRRLPFLDLTTLGSRYQNPQFGEYLREGLQLAGLDQPVSAAPAAKQD